MNRVEQAVREVSDMWDFARKMGWFERIPEYQAARRATAHWPENPKNRLRNPKKTRAKAQSREGKKEEVVASVWVIPLCALASWREKSLVKNSPEAKG